MKIAEVGVNAKSLPSKEQLVKQALKTKKFYQMPLKKALEVINKEIKDSGLFKASSKRVEKPDSDDSRPSRLPNARKRKVDKGKDKE